MSTFNPHYLARQIPAGTWQSYLAARGIAAAEDLDWSLEPKTLANALITLLGELESKQQAQVHAELRRVHRMATAKGVVAFHNAAPEGANLLSVFETLSNDAERALWTLAHLPNSFHAAEALLYFDLGVGRRSSKRLDIKVTEAIARAPEALLALSDALSQRFSIGRTGKRQCQVDICDRHLDGGVQVSVYLEDDPNDPLEFDDSAGLYRRPSRPTLNMALVFYADRGIVDSVARGGAKVHVSLVVLFARHLLGREVKPEAVKRPSFHLNRLRRGLALPEDCGIDLAAVGVEHIRMRQARVRSTQGPDCDYILIVPANQPRANVIAASFAHLRENDFFRNPYNLVEVLISVSFVPTEPGKRGRVMNIELNHNGFSNLLDLDEGDARLAEQLLGAWGVTEADDLSPAIPA